MTAGKVVTVEPSYRGVKAVVGVVVGAAVAPAWGVAAGWPVEVVDAELVAIHPVSPTMAAALAAPAARRARRAGCRRGGSTGSMGPMMGAIAVSWLRAGSEPAPTWCSQHVPRVGRARPQVQT